MKTTMFLPIFMLFSVFSASASTPTKWYNTTTGRVGIAALMGGTVYAVGPQLFTSTSRTVSRTGLPTFGNAAITEVKNNATKAALAAAASIAVVAQDHLPTVKDVVLEQATKKNAANFVALTSAAALVNGVRTGSWTQITGGAAALTLALNHSSFAPSNQNQTETK